MPNKNIGNHTSSTGALNLIKNCSNKKMSRKKSINNLTATSGKALKTIDSICSMTTLTKNNESNLTK